MSLREPSCRFYVCKNNAETEFLQIRSKAFYPRSKFIQFSFYFK